MLGRLTSCDPLHDAPLTERRLRELGVWLKWAAVALLVVMSGFHLYTGTFGVRTAMVQRAVHLTFALGLAMLLFGYRAGSRSRWLLGLDVVLGLAAAGCAAYVGVLHEELARRAGAPTTLDLVVAGAGIVLILEATRRSVSPALFGITLVFLAYALFGHRLPGEFGHSPLSLRRMLEHLFYTQEGVFGIPIKVSSTFVFLFVLFGAALNRSGAGQYLIDLSFATMGRFRGGPAKAAVFASGTMGTISGSSIANTVTTGSLTIPLMKQAGFKPHVAGAVEVAASTNGQLVPPVMGAAAFIMAEFTGIPYSTIIIAALLPALLSYLAIFTMIHLEAVKTGIKPGDPAKQPPLGRTLLRGLHLNLPLIAVLVFLLAWGYTPMTSATLAIWVTLGLFLGVALAMPRTAYGLTDIDGAKGQAADGEVGAGEGAAVGAAPDARPIGLPRRVGHFALRTAQAMRDGALNMVGIACACACCGIIIGVVSQTGLGLKITSIITSISGGHLLPALLLTAAACILLGVGLPTTATYIIMAALTATAILEIAGPATGPMPESLLLAAHLFVFYYGILADDTPPVGLCAYAAAGIAGSDPIRTGLTSFRFDLAAFTLPLIFFYNRELLLIDVTWVEVLWVLPGAVLGILCFAAALMGYTWRPVRWWGRPLLLAAAFLLIVPDWQYTLIGLGVLAVLLALQAVGERRAAGLDASGDAGDRGPGDSEGSGDSGGSGVTAVK
jgi:TRAP transporter 4TM/12TM fusion protein